MCRPTTFGCSIRVSVSDVEVSRDLAHAKVYVTALLAETASQALQTLNEAAKELRQELSRSSRMRSVPQLHFFYDDSVDRGERIEGLLVSRRKVGVPQLGVIAQGSRTRRGGRDGRV